MVAGQLLLTGCTGEGFLLRVLRQLECEHRLCDANPDECENVPLAVVTSGDEPAWEVEICAFCWT